MSLASIFVQQMTSLDQGQYSMKLGQTGSPSDQSTDHNTPPDRFDCVQLSNRNREGDRTFNSVGMKAWCCLKWLISIFPSVMVTRGVSSGEHLGTVEMEARRTENWKHGSCNTPVHICTYATCKNTPMKNNIVNPQRANLLKLNVRAFNSRREPRWEGGWLARPLILRWFLMGIRIRVRKNQSSPKSFQSPHLLT